MKNRIMKTVQVKQGKKMKLNKTLSTMISANAEGGAVTIYGDRAYRRILHFTAVVSCDTEDNIATLKLTDGSVITAFYSEIC